MNTRTHLTAIFLLIITSLSACTSTSTPKPESGIASIFTTQEARKEFLSRSAIKPATGETLMDIAVAHGCKYKDAKSVHRAMVMLEGSDIIFTRFFESKAAYRRAIRESPNACA